MSNCNFKKVIVNSLQKRAHFKQQFLKVHVFSMYIHSCQNFLWFVSYYFSGFKKCHFRYRLNSFQSRQWHFIEQTVRVYLKTATRDINENCIIEVSLQIVSVILIEPWYTYLNPAKYTYKTKKTPTIALIYLRINYGSILI